MCVYGTVERPDVATVIQKDQEPVNDRILLIQLLLAKAVPVQILTAGKTLLENNASG